MLFHTHNLNWLGECYRSVGIVVLLMTSALPVCLSAETVLPVLTTDTQLATAGYYQLSWQPGVAWASKKFPHFELQQATDEQFHTVKILYRGPDRASVVSGMADGDYYYRLRIVESTTASAGWSKPLLVRVRHHSIYKAWAFFGAGAFVFLTTLAFIVISVRNRDRT